MKSTPDSLYRLPIPSDGLVIASQTSLTKPGSALKRKRLSSSLTSTLSKKIKLELQLYQSAPSSFVRIIQQYGLLKSIVAHLKPEDLFALALSAKVFYHAIIPRRKSIENLLARMQCPGRGIQIRRRCHRKSRFFYLFGCTEYVTCGSLATNRVVDTRPCVECKVATCNECRIHCVYQSIYEKARCKDELPNFSGFVMLNANEIPILSPHHLSSGLGITEPPWQDPSTTEVGPYHDSGIIDVPLEESLYSAYGPLGFSSDSNVADPSPVLEALHRTTEQRKRWFCDKCLLRYGFLAENAHPRSCHCTLRSRYLDRWLCLRCYEAEDVKIQQGWPAHVDQCGCGNLAGRAICMWCWGLVRGPIVE